MSVVDRSEYLIQLGSVEMCWSICICTYSSCPNFAIVYIVEICLVPMGLPWPIRIIGSALIVRYERGDVLE